MIFMINHAFAYPINTAVSIGIEKTSGHKKGGE